MDWGEQRKRDCEQQKYVFIQWPSGSAITAYGKNGLQKVDLALGPRKKLKKKPLAALNPCDANSTALGGKWLFASDETYARV
jgi:hypothetical protein